ncbi:tryptophan synthase subunit beta [Candidatus Acetothermia bacterium]|nr:tryptophan synthase subunit beta [Candidatus Acetothermia bacterium]MBI3643832.1 tryptophan synthase subunit beta [Candidatus Acetothermia bacterium]
MARDDTRKRGVSQPVEEAEQKPEEPSGQPVKGYFGEFGGQEVPEALLPALQQLEATFLECYKDDRFQREFRTLLSDYGGRPSALYHARRLSQWVGGARIYLKREDLLNGGAHLINSAIGQALLAKKMGKKRLITESSSGEQGVVAAMVAAMVGLPIEIWMGQRDFDRQRRATFRMKLLGAKIRVIPGAGWQEAISETMRDWAAQWENTYYLMCSVVGPHPYPWIIREFQRVIGDELKGQILRKERRLPDSLIASMGGGSCAIGLFYPFVSEEFVHLVVAEPGGASYEEEAALGQWRVGIFHGMRSLVLQDHQGNVNVRRSVAPDLCYPAIGPEHAHLRSTGREERVVVRDPQALEAFRRLCQLEGIAASLESAHALSAAFEWAKRIGVDGLIVVALTGRSEKDLEVVLRASGSPTPAGELRQEQTPATEQ